MNKRQDDTATSDPLAKRAKTLFDESVEGLDAATRSKLNRGRQAAIAEAKANAGFRPLSPWVPAAGVAAAAVLAVVLWNGQAPVEEFAPDAVATDFEILLDDDSFEMLEDLEFYSWIDTEIELETTQEEESNVG
jgi:hypothetical protein